MYHEMPQKHVGEVFYHVKAFAVSSSFPVLKFITCFFLKMPHFQLLENLEMYSVPHLVVIMRRIGHFEEKARDQFDDEKITEK